MVKRERERERESKSKSDSYDMGHECLYSALGGGGGLIPMAF